MATKGKNGSGFYQPMGIKTLTKDQCATAGG